MAADAAGSGHHCALIARQGSSDVTHYFNVKKYHVATSLVIGQLKKH
jgi:hypothetical protein